MSDNNSDLEYDFSEEEIADEMAVLSDGDKTLNERLSASIANPSVDGSFRNEPVSLAVKDAKVVTFFQE